ncbi:hypothetical protein QJQ45_001887 [Haematococcus lacustris]|nr:hypothetical protein QJQ45_001887 [Haematococcus lacustris]
MQDYPGLTTSVCSDTECGQRPQAPPWGRWLDRDTNGCLNLQRIGESRQRPIELCRWEDLEALPPIGKEYQQGYKRVNDRLPKGRQWLHRAAEYRRGIDGASGSGQQVQGQGQAVKVVIAERRQVIKAALRGLVEAAQPDLSPAEVDAVVAEVNKRMTMGSKQCILAAVMSLTVLLLSFLGQPTPGFPAAAGPAPGPPPPPDPAHPPYAHPRIPTRSSPRSAAAPAQLPPPVQLGIWDPQLLAQIRDAMALLTKASVIEHMMRGPHHHGIRLLPGEVAAFEQPSSAWPVAMLQQLDEEPLTGDGNSLNANATTIITSIQDDLGMTTLTRLRQVEADSLPQWQKFIQYSQLQNSGWEFARRVETDGVSISVHFVLSQAVTEPEELPFIGCKLTATSDYDPTTHIAVGVDPGVTQAIKAGHAQRDQVTGQVLRQWEWELSKGQLKHDSGLTKATQDTARWSAAIQPQLLQLAAATPAGTTLGGLHAHVLALKATWDALWEEYLKPRWRRQRLALHHAQERIIEAFCKKVVNGMKWVSRHYYHQDRGVAVFLEVGNFSQGGWKAGAVQAGFRKVVEQPSRPSADPRPDRLVIVDEFRTTVSAPQCMPASLDPPPPPAQAPPPPPPAQAPPLPAAPGPGQRPQAPPWGRWLDRDTNGCLNLQRIGESRQRPIELCRWEDLEALPPIGKEYQQGYKRVNDRLPKGRQWLHRAAEYRRGIDGASGSGQQVQGQGQAVKVVIAERRQVIKAALRGLVEAAQPDLSPAEVDAVVAEVNKRMTMGSKQCILAAVMSLTVLLLSFLGQPTPGFPAAAGPAPGPPPPPDPAHPPYAHPRIPTRSSPRTAAAPAQLPPPVQLGIWDPQLLAQIRDAMALLTKASVIEHMMRGPHHHGIRLLPGEVAAFEQPSSAWPVAMLQQLDEEPLTGDGNSLNANATTIITSIQKFYRLRLVGICCCLPACLPAESANAGWCGAGQYQCRVLDAGDEDGEVQCQEGCTLKTSAIDHVFWIL